MVDSVYDFSDFAYVARDPVTRMHKCHVFRCEVPAKHVANTLKEICSRLAKERKNKTPSPDKPNDSSLHALELIAEKGKGMRRFTLCFMLYALYI